MKQPEVGDLNLRELGEAIKDKELELTRLTLSHAVSPLDSPMKIRNARRVVARLKTEMRKRQLTTTPDGAGK